MAESQRDRYGQPWQLVLPRGRIEKELRRAGVVYRRRAYDPVTTLYAWMSQIASQDRSMRHAVCRLVAFEAALGRRLSSNTGAYSSARTRLNCDLISTLMKEIGSELEKSAEHTIVPGRSVLLVDGTTFSGPDTPSNQAKYPQPKNAKDGIGFPLAKCALLVSAATGAVIEVGFAKSEGKGTGELSFLREFHCMLSRDDVLVGDRAYHSFWEHFDLSREGVSTVFRLRERFDPDTHKIAKTLGQGHWLVDLKRPTRKPFWVERIGSYPTKIPVRLISAHLPDRSALHLASTLTGGEISRKHILNAYRARWDIEVDLRSIKIDLGMEILRCKSGDMLDAEAWATLLTYNAIRAIIAKAAKRVGCKPRELSFKGAMQAIEAFGPRMEQASPAGGKDLGYRLLDAIGTHKVGNRPGRAEPRLVKRRRKDARLMTIPREEARKRLRGGRFR